MGTHNIAEEFAVGGNGDHVGFINGRNEMDTKRVNQWCERRLCCVPIGQTIVVVCREAEGSAWSVLAAV